MLDKAIVDMSAIEPLDHTLESAHAWLTENARLRRACEQLEIERRTLTEQLATYRMDLADLRKSAFVWIHLYEQQLRRANRALEGAASPTDRSAAG